MPPLQPRFPNLQRLLSLCLTGAACLLLVTVTAWPDWDDWAGSPVPVYSHGDARQPAIAFTFDDGPSPRWTPALLQLLNRFAARATFFVQGAHVRRYPHLVRDIVAAGHEVGNHTFSHPHLPQLSDEELSQEIETTAFLLRRLGAGASGLFRPPYSQFSDDTEDYIHHTGRRLILWTIDAGDWLGLPATEITRRVLAALHPGAIIVFHDSNETDNADRQPTLDALATLLPLMQRQGYACVTVSELLPPAAPANPSHASASPPAPTQLPGS